MKIPTKFFAFDLKDTFRLVVWVVMASFVLGGLYAQRAADVAKINANAEALAAKVAKIEKTAEKSRDGQSEILAETRAIRVEIRYTNEKIDVLRADLRETRK